jgi:uncharacterized peroxidase-related enzyme
MHEFKFYTPDNSSGEAKQILTDVQGKYGFVPNLFAYMAEAPYIIEAYSVLNDILARTGLTAAQQQTALLAVSNYNNCKFCRVAHQAFGKMNQANPQTLKAIVDSTVIEDVTDKALVDMVIAIVDGRGRVSDEQLENFFSAGFDRRNVYDLILIVTIKTLSNYSNHLTEPEANEQLVAMI